jgi:hypothetical protein
VVEAEEMVRENRLRSLERERMYTIFAPLDANEPLPRELLIEARRHRTVGRRELAGFLWLPALVVVSFIAQWIQLNAPVTLASMALLLIGLVVFVRSGGRKAPLK